MQASDDDSTRRLADDEPTSGTDDLSLATSKLNDGYGFRAATPSDGVVPDSNGLGWPGKSSF